MINPLLVRTLKALLPKEGNARIVTESDQPETIAHIYWRENTLTLVVDKAPVLAIKLLA